MTEISRLQGESVRDRDAREFSLGDTLDVKTSVILAVIVFLAAQSEHFFQDSLTPCVRDVQYISAIALVAGGISAVLELIPRNYQAENSPSSYGQWISDLERYYAGQDNADASIAEQFVKGYVARTTERIEANIAVNQRKSLWLNVCFISTVVSLAANLFTLITRLF